ncbi:MAG TPA: phosphoribosylformylglycinamidine synthase subunit PurL [Nitriliruptorales bacterium]|nr:phosphoribosylformylglycinamidine synthase subunit PurL [Nitriliruptorales bacterium]
MREPPTVETAHGVPGPAPDLPPDETLDRAAAERLAAELGLTSDEYARIVATLGRTPSTSELGMYSVMWSEHCSYKSSRIHLATLPTEAPHVLVGPGENAGVVDVGDGLAVTFKIESHNHPSFVEPYQGAATGVGGIIRDILSMGARPVALMDPLRFGEPGDPLQRHLVDGVVRGVGGYGNCVGVPNIGGETVFDDGYATNPLVNVLCIGVLRRDRLRLARARRAGDLAVLVGSATGRDGIGGASVLASATFDGQSTDRRPNVQVGDPFAGKLLIECCLELYERGLVSAIQDMGAAGITCSTAEMASRAGLGMRIDLSRVHLREPSMASWEILCSESQERMLALVAPGDLDAVLAVCRRWEVPASVLGEVTEGDLLEVRRDGHVVARVPARSLAEDGPVYHRPATRPAHQDRDVRIDTEALHVDADLAVVALDLLASPNVASKRWVWEQYDALVGACTVTGPGGDAGVVRLPGSRRAVACATDGHGRWCELDPREGTRRIVAEAARNVACAGARPLAVTNCLNFGDPERPEVMWQFAEAVAGLAEACAALGTPVTGGNVSFYNETAGRAIPPTPVVGVLGVIEDADHAVGIGVDRDGDLLYQLGLPTGPGLAGSELQRLVGAPLTGRLAPVDLASERRLHAALAELAGQGVLRSAHDVSGGGMLATLAESALAGGRGLRYVPEPGIAPLHMLFSEAPTRVVVSVRPDRSDALEATCAAHGVPARRAGEVGGQTLIVQGAVELPLAAVRDAVEGGLPRSLGVAACPDAG